ncbi:MAG TPA: DVU3141 family protein [Steroidobacteraceae bacterium]|nr:DVU3141 family protein [Steroidobacteraceae bacterium]
MKITLTILMLGICAAPVAVAQVNLGELRDAPSAKFTARDFEMLWATVDEVSRAKPGTVKKWANADTGSGGAIKLLKVFTSTDGRDCRGLRIDNYARSLKGSSKQIVCADPEGKWMLDANARAAPKPKS